ncbi:MAG TPA: DMT family transporter [Actinomycetes bacterium]|nr:DMT family transporter [Actinomycetes bacterium]
MSDPGRQLSGAVAFGAGLVVAVQGRINGEVGDLTGNGVVGAILNFSVGLLLLIVVVGSRKVTRDALRGLPALIGPGLPWWTLTGGVGGAIYVTGQSTTVAVLGVALFTVATVAGSTGAGLLVDKVGLGPGGRVPVTAWRVVASILAVVAVWVGSGGRDDAGAVSIPFLLLALAAGAAGAAQVAVNGRVSTATRQPLVATLVNFVVGLTTLLLILAGQWLLTPDRVGSLAPVAEKPWLLVGGAMGVLFVAGSAWSVRALGVLLLSLVVLAGTLVGAVVVDLAVPTEGASVNGYLLMGIALTFASVGLAVVRRRGRAA